MRPYGGDGLANMSCISPTAYAGSCCGVRAPLETGKSDRLQSWTRGEELPAVLLNHHMQRGFVP